MKRVYRGHDVRAFRRGADKVKKINLDFCSGRGGGWL